MSRRPWASASPKNLQAHVQRQRRDVLRSAARHAALEAARADRLAKPRPQREEADR
jgi:hypothetical protein